MLIQYDDNNIQNIAILIKIISFKHTQSDKSFQILAYRAEQISIIIKATPYTKNKNKKK